MLVRSDFCCRLLVAAKSDAPYSARGHFHAKYTSIQGVLLYVNDPLESGRKMVDLFELIGIFYCKHLDEVASVISKKKFILVLRGK